MLLGKRARPPIKRTTSMTGITVDHPSSDHETAPPLPSDRNDDNAMNDMSLEYFMSMLSPRPNNNNNNRSAQRRNSADFVETAHFLRTCGLCSRRLASGRDIYMYMGDTAFCSLECREKQMKLDERREKSGKTGPTAIPESGKTTGSNASYEMGVRT